MVMLPGLEFVDSSLSVAYRASREPQILRIWLAVERVPDLPIGPLSVPLLRDIINAGGAGGSEFAPTEGAATLLSGPTGGSPDAFATSYDWQIEVTAVSPLFLRTIIEHLRFPARGWRVRAMSISGSLPPDAKPLSVREGQVRAWLHDFEAYPGVFPDPGFPIVDRELKRGAGIRLTLGQDVNRDLLMRFHATIELFGRAVSCYINGSRELPGVADGVPRISRAKRELAAGYDAFDFAREHARATLVNMLSRFHQRVAPILEAQVALA